MTNNIQNRTILIIDDEKEAVAGTQFMLETAGYTDILGCTDSRLVMKLIRKFKPACVLLDLSMPYLSGEAILKKIQNTSPHIPVIILTGMNNIETAVFCIQNGAFNYLVKPVDESRFLTTVENALNMAEIQNEYTSFKNRIFSNTLENKKAFKDIVTNDKGMHSLFHYCETIASSPRTVLINGETGTGKELFAKAIHCLGKKKDAPFVAVNVAGLDDNMFSDTLFGHVKGAFTGANSTRMGMIEKANNGTLFLDEIGDLSTKSQIKLLRILQEKEYIPLGADVAKPVETRIIVATNKNLSKLQKNNKFRSDLYYRLHTHNITIPPLSSRLNDMPLLVNYFIEKSALELKKRKPCYPNEIFSLLCSYSFPGNIRELESMLFEAVSRNESNYLLMSYLKEYIDKNSINDQKQHTISDDEDNIFSLFPRLPTLTEAPLLLIKEAMKRSGNNQTIASKLIGISRSGLSKSITRNSISL